MGVRVGVGVGRDRALSWTIEEVLRRRTMLLSGPLLVQRYLSDARSEMSGAEIAKTEEIAADYRVRLYDVSWFMRTLNEYIAPQGQCRVRGNGPFLGGALQEPSPAR